MASRFAHRIGSGDDGPRTTTMSDEEESQELVMIAEKARSLLNRNERQVLSHCCHSYLSGRMGVHHFVDALLRLLPTPDKVIDLLSFF